MKFITWIIFGLIFFVQDSSAMRDNNAAVLDGQSVMLVCDIIAPSVRFWSFTAPGGQPISICTSGCSFPIAPYSSTCNGGVCTLTANPIVEADGGNYVCGSTGSDNAGAEVVVLGATPTCSSNNASVTEGNPISVTCSASYQGNFDPLMNFTESNGNQIYGKGVSNVTVHTHSVSYTLHLTANLTQQSVSCVLYFGAPTGLSSPASTNAPQYTATTPCTLPNVTEVTNPAASNQLSLILGLAIGLPLGALCIIVIIILVICLRRRPTTPPPSASSTPANVGSRNGSKYTSHQGPASDFLDSNLTDYHHYDHISGTASYKVDTKLPDPYVATVYSNGR